MSIVGGLSASTFRPALDRYVASDCEGVVLWSTARHILVLTAETDGWCVRAHALLDPDRSDDTSLAPVPYRGQWYEREGEFIIRFAAAAPEADWEQFYAGLHRWRPSASQLAMA